MRWFEGLATRIGHRGALANARRELESSRAARAQVDAVARRLSDPKARRRRSHVA